MSAESRPQSPDDRVDEVAGPPFTPIETASAIGTGVIGLLIAGLFGLLLSALAEEGRLSASGIGLTAMLEALSSGLVAGLAGIVLKPRHLRIVGAVAAVAAVTANLATMSATNGAQVMAIRMLAGVPEGLLLWVCIGLISRTETPERWAGVLFTGMGLTQLAAATGLTAVVLPRWGANGGYATVAAAVALALPLTPFLPRSYGGVAGQEPGGGGAPPFRGWLALAGTLLFAAPIAGVSVYMIPLAQQAGLSVGVGRTAISVNLGAQIVGGALATALAGQVRWIGVFFVVSAAMLATWAVYALHAGPWLFIGMSGLAGMAGMLAYPFFVPMTIDADPSRRAAMQSGPVQMLAGALGPFLGSVAVQGRNVHGVLVQGAALLLGGLLVMLLVLRLAERSRTAA